MSIQAILLPLFVEVALTLRLAVVDVVWRAAVIFAAARCIPRKLPCASRTGPARTQQISYSFSNQFELPVLFYVLTILEIITRHADLVFVVLAWIFVIDAARPSLCAYHQQPRDVARFDLRHRRSGADRDVGRSSWSASCWACHDAGRAARRRHRSFRQSGERAPPGGRRAQELGLRPSLRRLRRPRRHRGAGLRRAAPARVERLSDGRRQRRAPFCSACSSASAASTARRSPSSPTARTMGPRRSAMTSASVSMPPTWRARPRMSPAIIRNGSSRISRAPSAMRAPRRARPCRRARRSTCG